MMTALATLLLLPLLALADPSRAEEEVWEKDMSDQVYIEAAREGFQVWRKRHFFGGGI